MAFLSASSASSSCFFFSRSWRAFFAAFVFFASSICRRRSTRRAPLVSPSADLPFFFSARISASDFIPPPALLPPAGAAGINGFALAESVAPTVPNTAAAGAPSLTAGFAARWLGRMAPMPFVSASIASEWRKGHESPREQPLPSPRRPRKKAQSRDSDSAMVRNVKILD